MKDKCEKLEEEVKGVKEELKRVEKDRISKLVADVKELQEDLKKEKNIKGLTQKEFKDIATVKQEMEGLKKEWEGAKAEKGKINQAVSEVREENEGLKKLWSEVVSAGKEAAVFDGEEGTGTTSKGGRKINEVAEAVERENRKKI